MTLPEILEVLRRAEELAGEIENAETALADLKKQRENLTRNILPEMMRTAGITDCRTGAGRKVALREFHVGRITEATAREAFAWLDANNCGGIAKDTVKIELGRGMDEVASKVMAEMHELGVVAERKRAIHPSTLNAFVSEQMKDHPDTFPQHLFGVTAIAEVTIK